LTQNVSQCKDSLQSEADDKASIQIKVNALEVKITEIQNSLDISQKAVQDANSETRQCLEDSDGLKIVIEQLNRTVKDQSNEISRLDQQSISQQSDLTTCGEKLDHCSTNYILSQSTIESLRETITDIEKINARLNTDSTQCKHDLESSLKEAHTCSETNTNLNTKITEISDKLTYCETDGHKNSLQIISLKSSSDELRNNLSTCQSEKSTLSELLNAKIADYNQEELERQEEMALLKTSQALLKQCTSSKDEIDAHYQIEKDNVIELTNTLARVRTECTDSFNNCNQQIQQLLDNLNQCRTTLQSESNVKASIEVQLKNLEIEYTNIQHVLDITKKAVDEANKNVKTCEEEKADLDAELSGLSCTVDTYLKFVKEREASAYQSFNDGIDQFIGSNNIQCTLRP
jgi:chromosome segregation ATPase